MPLLDDEPANDTIAAKVPRYMRDFLRQCARQNGRSVSWEIRRAVRHLMRHEKQAARRA